jgi:hypothetical protein
LPFFHSFPIFSLFSSVFPTSFQHSTYFSSYIRYHFTFQLLFFHIFHIFSQFTSIFSKSFLY